MSLPWFAFNIGAYVKDTMRLTTEGHGAYLLLILDYYATETAPPDDDEVLAAICKLPVEIWREKHRKVLLPFFSLESGHWKHERIEREILEAHSKHTTAKAKASAAGLASAAKRASSRPEVNSKPKSNPKPEPSAPVAQQQVDLKPTHLHLQKKDSLSTADEVLKEADPNEGPLTPVPTDFAPGPNELAICRFDGATEDEVKAEVAAFIAHHREHASFSADWDASWSKWWKRWREHRAKTKAKEAPKAPPRIEINAVPDWNSFAKRFAGGMGWPRGIGGEPGTASCRCPADVLIAHGIDPVTGLKQLKQAAS